MGIGNLEFADPADFAYALITPHGDWKLVDQAAAHQGAVASLPLMGIGNGVGNGVAGGGDHLITPHGDWKPLLFSRFHVLMMSGASQNKHPWAINLCLSAKPGMVLCSSA